MKEHTTIWGDYWSISSGQSQEEEVPHLAQHWSDWFVLMYPVHKDDKTINDVYACEVKTSPPLDALQQGAIQDARAPEVNEQTILSPDMDPTYRRSKEDYMNPLAASLPMARAKALTARCTRQVDPRLPSPAREGHSPPTTLFQLLNHQSSPTLTETATRYTPYCRRGRKRSYLVGKNHR